MKKILIINTAGLGVGGITQHMLNYLEALKQKGVALEITVGITGVREVTVLNQLRGLGCNLHFLPHRQKALGPYLRALRRLLKSENFEVLHVHGNSSTMALELNLAKFYGVPIRIAHSHNSRCSQRLGHWLLSPIFRSSYTQAVACSDLAGRWLFGPRRFSVLPNAIDIERYRFDVAKRKERRLALGVAEDTFLLGHVGNFNEQKNQAFLLEILKQLRTAGVKAQLLLLGQGKQLAKVKAQAYALGLADEVYFLGLSNEVPAWLQAMDAFVLPSKWEGFGMVLLEAQVAGLPTLASDQAPKDVQVSSQLTYLPLDAGAKRWSEQLLALGRMRVQPDRRLERYRLTACLEQLQALYGI